MKIYKPLLVVALVAGVALLVSTQSPLLDVTDMAARNRGGSAILGGASGGAGRGQHDEVISTMLTIADISASDVLYDLGSGDGALVIAAVREYGVRGVGVDPDENNIRAGRRAASALRIGERAKFVRQDLSKADLDKATVVTMRLPPDAGFNLRGKLLQELRPGTRLISYGTDMRDWTPDRIAKIGDRTVYLWVVPADVSGVWQGSLQTDTGEAVPYIIQLTQRFQKVTGVIDLGGDSIPLENVRLEGDRLEFSFRKKIGEETVAMRFKGRAGAQGIEGMIEAAPLTRVRGAPAPPAECRACTLARSR